MLFRSGATRNHEPGSDRALEARPRDRGQERVEHDRRGRGPPVRRAEHGTFRPRRGALSRRLPDRERPDRSGGDGGRRFTPSSDPRRPSGPQSGDRRSPDRRPQDRPEDDRRRRFQPPASDSGRPRSADRRGPAPSKGGRRFGSPPSGADRPAKRSFGDRPAPRKSGPPRTHGRPGPSRKKKA